MKAKLFLEVFFFFIKNSRFYWKCLKRKTLEKIYTESFVFNITFLFDTQIIICLFPTFLLLWLPEKQSGFLIQSVIQYSGSSRNCLKWQVNMKLLRKKKKRRLVKFQNLIYILKDLLSHFYMMVGETSLRS